MLQTRIRKAVMRQDHAIQNLWTALVAVEQYIAHGLQEQVSASKSFGGSDMRPMFDAHRVLMETHPFLPQAMANAADSALRVAELELNKYLDLLRDAIQTSDEERDAAIAAISCQNRVALSAFRDELKSVKRAIPLSSASDSGRVIHNYGQIGVIGDNANVKDQSYYQSQVGYDLGDLAFALGILRAELRTRAAEVHQDQAVAEIASAEDSAQNGDEEKTLSHLKAAGKWALDVATQVGVPMATKAIESALRMP